MRAESITYEVELEPDAEILGEFEAWLEYHVDEMLALPGFTGATIHKAENPDSGAALRVVRYELADRAALERYLEEFAPRMRAEGTARFGNRFRARRRIVLEGRDAALTDARPCPNCSELLWGQYCANCGQRARARMITFWELLKDAGDLLASLDSRIWKTLGLLMFRPGRLTLEYLQGKRARFVPPVRLFIASSIVFFFIASLNTRFEFGPDDAVLIGPGAGIELEDAERSERSARRKELVLQALEEAERRAAEPGADPEAREAIERARRALEGLDQDAGEADEEGAQAPRARGASGTAGGLGFDRDCNVDYSAAPDWLVKLVPPERAVEICERITADHGRSFARALLSNVPAMMFLFLPLMGIVMKLAYPLSGRYYAEHLLFLVHYHSFFFLLNILLIVARWGAELVAPGTLPLGLLTAAVFVYIPVYLFRAMRVVYGQGFWATSFKYIVLGLAYLTALLTTFLGLVLYTAVTL
jgi:hypothetical protein